MDDTTDKVRRNIVTFSAAILGTSFLQLKLEKFGMIGIDLSGVSPLRVWIVLFAVLVYLFMRYHFDDNTHKEREKSYRDFIASRAPIVARMISSDLESFLAGDRPSIYTKQADWIGEDFASAKRRLIVFERFTINCVSSSDFTGRTGDVKLGVEFHFKSMSDQSQSLQRGAKYEIPKPRWYLVTIWNAIRQAAYSRSSVNVFVPYALALVAAVIVTWRVVNHL